MRYLLLLIFVVACGKNEAPRLSRDFVAAESPADPMVVSEAESTYKSILRSQESALNSFSDKSSGFQMNEMITDISFAKTGVLGLSALKANSGVEVRWARRSLPDTKAGEKLDYVVEEGTTVQEATEGVLQLVKASGKVRITDKLRTQIENSLKQIEALATQSESSASGRWRFRGVRFDLNFSANGEIWFFAKAGPNFRLRMEWNHTPRSEKNLSSSGRFIRNLLAVLNEVKDEIHLPGFTVRQVSIGVGSTFKGDTGVWKYSAGFLGFLIFVPRNEKFLAPIVPVGTEDILLGGFDEKGMTTNRLSPARFTAGLKKSLRTASFFADASRSQSGSWHVREIKTVNEISQTGLFGLADLSARGVLEIDFTRKAE